MLEDFAMMCHFHQTSPKSSFTQRNVCSLAMPDGRVTLQDMRLITTRNGTKTEAQVENEEEYCRLPRERFGIELTES